MKKIIEDIKKNFKIYAITFLISSLIGIGIFLTFYFVEEQSFSGSLNGTSVAFASLFGISILLWIGRMGAFDTMSYGFKQMFASMFAKDANKYNDFMSYKDEKNTKRKASTKYYFVMMLVSFIFLITFIILEIVKYNTFGV